MTKILTGYHFTSNLSEIFQITGKWKKFRVMFVFVYFLYWVEIFTTIRKGKLVRSFWIIFLGYVCMLVTNSFNCNSHFIYKCNKQDFCCSAHQFELFIFFWIWTYVDSEGMKLFRLRCALKIYIWSPKNALKF